MGVVSFSEDTKLPQDTQIEEEQTSVFNYQDGPENKSWAGALPLKQGLYDPELEKDACGVGFAAHIKGKASHKIVSDGKSDRDISSTQMADQLQRAHCCAT
jgi:glutamate synthase (NADH)